MNKEQLQKGTELAAQIEKLEAQLAGWEYATGFNYETVTLSANVDGNSRTLDKIQSKYIDFNIVRTLTIDKLNKELAELRTEFDNL